MSLLRSDRLLIAFASVMCALQAVPTIGLAQQPPATADRQVAEQQLAENLRLDRPLRVMTANIWNYQEPYAARMKLLRARIEALSPDLIGFQEAGWAPGEEHQVSQLLKDLGYFIHHERDGIPPAEQPTKKQLLDVAVASRWPTSKVELWQLPGTGKALAVQVAVPEPFGPLLFVSTFGTARWQLNRESYREQGAVALDQHVRERASSEGFPPIIAGDFDAVPEAASIRYLTGLQSLAGKSTHYRDAWAWAGDPEQAGFTWTTRSPYVAKIARDAFQADSHHRRIDYILVGSPHHYRRLARIVSCRVVLDSPDDAGVWPSDHFGVLAEISTEQ